jgi:hypothetical protein
VRKTEMRPRGWTAVRGSLLTAVMIHVECKQDHVNSLFTMQNTFLAWAPMLISQITFSGVLSEPLVMFVIKTRIGLIMRIRKMMQLWRDCRDVKYHQRCT